MDAMRKTMTRKISLIFLLILALIHAPCFGKRQHTLQWRVDNVLRMLADDSGHAVKCGKVDFDFSWTPKDLSPSGQVKVSLDYTAPQDLNGGFFNATLYLHDKPDILMQYGDSFDCNFLKKYGVPCPVKKGFHVNISKIIPNLQLLSNYPGSYDATFQVWNSQSEEMICANLTVTVLDG